VVEPQLVELVAGKRVEIVPDRAVQAASRKTSRVDVGINSGTNRQVVWVVLPRKNACRSLGIG